MNAVLDNQHALREQGIQPTPLLEREMRVLTEQGLSPRAAARLIRSTLPPFIQEKTVRAREMGVAIFVVLPDDIQQTVDLEVSFRDLWDPVKSRVRA